MSRISQMNGKPFTHFSYADFSTPGRRTQVGRHTSVEAAGNFIRRCPRDPADRTLRHIYGHMWIEDAAGTITEVS